MTAQQVWDAIIKHPNECLRKRTEAIDDSSETDRVVERILNMSRWGTGRIIGLSSVQIGEPGRIITYQRHSDREWIALVNPVIVARSDAIEQRVEGCGSLPNVWRYVPRTTGIEVRHDGGTLTAAGTDARIIMHEIDHIDGILITDYMGAGLE